MLVEHGEPDSKGELHPASDDEDPIGGSHKKLLSAVSQLYNKQRVGRPQRREPAVEVSEFHLSSAKTASTDDVGATGAAGGTNRKNEVAIGELVRALNKRGGHKTISDRLKQLKGKGKTLPKPVEKIHADKITRVIGYRNLRKHLGRWEALVQRNRAADQIIYPLPKNDDVKIANNPNDFLTTFKTPTELELQVAAVLNKSAAHQEEKKIEEELYPLSIEEMVERRKMLARVRSQESYKMAKAARQNKIKSKKYRRIVRQERMKEELKAFEALKETDPEAALEKLQQLERARAEERASLRHRNTGQWAKSRAIRAKYDRQARADLAEQLAKSRELTQKLRANDESSSDGGEEEDVPTKNVGSNGANPWITGSEPANEVQNFISGYRKFWDEQKKKKEEAEEATFEKIGHTSVGKKPEVNGEMEGGPGLDTIRETDESDEESGEFSLDEDEISEGPELKTDKTCTSFNRKKSVNTNAGDLGKVGDKSVERPQIVGHEIDGEEELPDSEGSGIPIRNNCRDEEIAMEESSEDKTRTDNEEEVPVKHVSPTENVDCTGRETTTISVKADDSRSDFASGQETILISDNSELSDSADGGKLFGKSTENSSENHSSGEVIPESIFIKDANLEQKQDDAKEKSSEGKSAVSEPRSRESLKHSDGCTNGDLTSSKTGNHDIDPPSELKKGASLLAFSRRSCNIDAVVSEGISAKHEPRTINEESARSCSDSEVLTVAANGNKFFVSTGEEPGRKRRAGGESRVRRKRRRLEFKESVLNLSGSWTITPAEFHQNSRFKKKKSFNKRSIEVTSFDPETTTRDSIPDGRCNFTVSNMSYDKSDETSGNDGPRIEEMFERAERVMKRMAERRYRSVKEHMEKVSAEDKNEKEGVGEKRDYEPDLSMRKSRLRSDMDEAMIELAQGGISNAPTLDLKRLLGESDGLDDLDLRETKGRKDEDIDPNKFLNVRPRHIPTAVPDLVTGGGEDAIEDPEEEEDEENQKRLNLAEAFADDDVVDEFRRDKEEEVKGSQPQEVDLSLPGWGRWDGANINRLPKRKRRRFIVRFPKLERKDKNKPNIIITERGNQKIKQHMVSDIPHPFTSVKDFEASIRAPLGGTWVPQSAQKRLIARPTVTKKGTIIEPIDDSQLINAKNRK